MTILDHAPRLTIDEAKAIASDVYPVRLERLSPLPSDRDQNFLIVDAEGDSFVLKISNATEDRSFLDAQNQMMARVWERSEHGARIVESRNHNSIETLTFAEEQHFVRLVTYVDGVPLSGWKCLSKPLLCSLGEFIGRVTNQLDGFDHPALHRDFHWDLAHANELIQRRLPLVSEDGLRSRIEVLTRKYQEKVRPIAGRLPKSAIHNDANDANLLVRSPSPEDVFAARVDGLIDFGDAMFGWTIADLAIAIAYAMLRRTGSPLETAKEIIRGYLTQRTLSEDEADCLFGLVCMRLCLSAAIAAEQTAARPDDPYLSVSQAPIRRVLPQLCDIPFPFAALTIRHLCELPLPPRFQSVPQWLAEKQNHFAFPINPSAPGDRPAAEEILVFDLSVESNDLSGGELGMSEVDMTAMVFDKMGRRGASVGIGRYLEPRTLYTSRQFQSGEDAECLPRTIHLGMDLFAPAGTDVIAPCEGQVIACERIDLPLDYGGVVLLQHRTGDGEEFCTLYGHLDPVSIESLVVGDVIGRGQVFAQLGPPEVNGGWTPHLHFQIVVDLLGMGHRFPGVVRASEKSIWAIVSPDPNVMLGLPENSFPPMGADKRATLKRRKRLLGSSLRLSYREPLKMVRGWGQYLYDETGRKYLDAYNNVPHVGHSHPAIVEAVSQQMALLNTNTRYLHDLIVELADRITSTLPDPLSVCYFLNSASEANELAVRLARCHTGARDLIVLEGGYHGHTTTLIEMSPYKHDGPGGFGAADWVHVVALADVYRGAHRDAATAGAQYAQYVEQAIGRLNRDGKKLCGFIAESCPSVGGQIIFPDQYLSRVYQQVRAAGGVCIADDVQTGYGRLGTEFYGFQLQSVIPDIVVLGKPIGNGHPLAAVITTPAIAEEFDNGMEFFSTFGGNPVSCAAGLAVLDVLQRERLQNNALHLGQVLMDELCNLKNEFRMIGDVRGSGFFLGVDLVSDPETREPASSVASWVVNRMRDRGILIGTEGAHHNVLKIRPPMVFDSANATFLTAALQESLRECEA